MGGVNFDASVQNGDMTPLLAHGKAARLLKNSVPVRYSSYLQLP